MFKVGDVVIAISKSDGCSLRDCKIWQHAKIQLGYMFVARIDKLSNNKIRYVCNKENSISYGDYFLECDLKLFYNTETIIEYAKRIGGV